MRVLFLAAAIAVAPLAQAEIYKCVVNGHTMFTQQPCGEDAVEVKPRVLPPSVEAVEEQHAVDASVRSAASRMEQGRRLVEIQRRIEEIDIFIADLMRERDQRIADLRRRQRFAGNYGSGANLRQSLATEMEAVAVQYDTNINSAQLEKSRLLDEYNRLRSTTP